MLIGAMNNPSREVTEEIEWMVQLGLDFIDLTIEPPSAPSWLVDVARLRTHLEHHHLPVVGHTAWYLPFASPFEEIRRAAVAEACRCVDIFAELGAQVMNVHPDRTPPLHPRSFGVRQNLRSFEELLEFAGRRGVRIMLENTLAGYNDAAELAELLDPLPELSLHLDIGHANLVPGENTSGEILARFGHRLLHVHLHDNRGDQADLHLPLGTGTVDTTRWVRELKRLGYDGTITLEVFSDDHRFLEYSRDVLRAAWAGA